MTSWSRQDRLFESVYALQEVISWSLSQLGLILTDKFHQTEDGEEYLRMAMKIDPGNWAFACNLAHILNIGGKYEAAKIASEQAIKWNAGGSFEALYNYGVILTNLGLHEIARDTYKKAIEKANRPTQADYNISVSHLLLGDWEEGWKAYEARFEVFPKTKMVIDRFKGFIPVYKKGDDLKGKVIYVFNEQGVGDLINFVRYIPSLKKLGAAKVIVEVQKFAAPLLEGQLQIDQVVPREDGIWPPNPTGVDYVVSINSLPGIFNAGVKPIPAKPYLKAPKTPIPEVINEAKDKFKIGICWAGNPDHLNDWRRTCLAKYFLALKLPGVQLFSFQKNLSMLRVWKGTMVNLLDGYTGEGVVDLDPYLHNFADAACFINEMDLIITVDTSIAHIAGAIGKPVWVILDPLNDWRWQLKKETTHWYSTMRLFRQKTILDWVGVFDQLVSSLESYQKLHKDQKDNPPCNRKGLKKRSQGKHSP